jgi:hypothetical protein
MIYFQKAGSPFQAQVEGPNESPGYFSRGQKRDIDIPQALARQLIFSYKLRHFMVLDRNT